MFTEPIAIQIAIAVMVVILTAYSAGRVHEWYRHGFERDVAYREGYDQASRTLFPLAVRTVPAKSDAPAPAPAEITDMPTTVRAVVPFRSFGDWEPTSDLFEPRVEASRY